MNHRIIKRYSWLTVFLTCFVVSCSFNSSQVHNEKQCLILYPWSKPVTFQPNNARKEPCRPVYYGMGNGDGVLDQPCYELQRELVAAAADGQVEKVKELLAAGANASATAGDSNSALQAAARGGYLEVAVLLLNNGADVNHYHPISGSPLTSAIYGGQTKVVELLLSRGANPNDKADGGTPLRAAKKLNNREIIALLEKVGAME